MIRVDGRRDSIPPRVEGHEEDARDQREVDFLELRRVFGRSVITGLARLGGRPVGVLASDCQQLGGAVDSEAADKATRFFDLCDRTGLPVISLVDTPGFMVGPDSETEAAVARMSALFRAGATLRTQLLAVFLRKGYGLGAMALSGSPTQYSCQPNRPCTRVPTGRSGLRDSITEATPHAGTFASSLCSSPSG